MKKIVYLSIFLLLAGMRTFAQEGKLKNVQTTSIWAPEKIKVDGNLQEWDDTFQAYNNATKLFYTVSNDDKYLYLIVKSIDITNNAKIIAGGITLTLNTEGKKKDKDAYNVTYPVIPRAPRQRGQGGGGRGGFGGGGGFGFGGGGRGAAPDSAAIALQHQKTIEAAKEIRVLGFKDITDTLISIYNEFSIKAAIGYDKVGNYDYELAIPLKLLNVSPDKPKDIAYNVKVNGIQIPTNFGGNDGGGFGGGAGGGRGGGRGGAGGGVRINGGGFPGGPRDPEMFSPTDFWAKYTLAKK
jgi:hypothetical protein